jgi:hypothetical protein
MAWFTFPDGLEANKAPSQLEESLNTVNVTTRHLALV